MSDSGAINFTFKPLKPDGERAGTKTVYAMYTDHSNGHMKLVLTNLPLFY